ncbi:protein-methionine-sulfoxide reductase heme-binding subunit MsrQ [Halioxenophilus aromaticivorans]|uniref:Protein-methionine-sulfoxide reductase heme-binding subunit MsrQ n=1 Tax=Halioxenophilus aromaticivorans TaxID=1306992 RepID=A0AAV3U0N8_9ALTE
MASAYWSALNDTIGGDPVESLIHFYGLSALRLLLLSLVLTPLVRFSRQPALMRLRRPLGLWAAAFATAHLAVYVVYDLQMNWALVLSEVIERPYITVGFVAWLVLSVLAVTSLPRLVRALGKRWKPLHNTVYLAAALVCLHFLWSVKADIVEPGLYILILAVLLFLRKEKLFRYFRSSKPHNG